MLNTKKLLIILVVLSIGVTVLFADSDWSGSGTHSDPLVGPLTWSGTWKDD